METSKSLPKSPAVAFFAGLVGAMLAILYYLAHAAPTDGYSHFHATRAFESSLLLSEGLIALTFAVVALFIHVQTRTNSSASVVAYLGATGRALFLGWQFAGHWKPGWHYIMDPADSTASSWFLIVAGVVQVVALAWAGRWQPTPPPATTASAPPSEATPEA